MDLPLRPPLLVWTHDSLQLGPHPILGMPITIGTLPSTMHVRVGLGSFAFMTGGEVESVTTKHVRRKMPSCLRSYLLLTYYTYLGTVPTRLIYLVQYRRY